MLNPETPPEIDASRWLNTEEPIALSNLKGKVVLVAVFQQHCPGSVKHGLPQAERLNANFSGSEVTVLGLNTPFEEFAKQTDALETFVAEQELTIPVALDVASGKDKELPKTFAAYELQGTPAILLFDRQGRLRRHYLGQVDDVRLGAEVMALAIEAPDAPRQQSIALERCLAAALVDPNAHHHHHDGECCGHDHHHHHGDGACCGHDHGTKAKTDGGE